MGLNDMETIQMNTEHSIITFIFICQVMKYGLRIKPNILIYKERKTSQGYPLNECIVSLLY